MLSQTPSMKARQKDSYRDRKKMISQIDIRNLKPLDDKVPFASPKFINYGVSLTNKNAPSKTLSFGLASPKSFYAQYRKEGSESRHSYTRSETIKSFTNKYDSKSSKDATMEGIAKIDQGFKAFPYANTMTASQIGNKNLTLTPKKSFKTEISTLETKHDISDKVTSPKYDEKYKGVKQNEVIKQIEAQIQLHRRVKKPSQVTKSVALTTMSRDLSLEHESKISDGNTHRRSHSTKDIPWAKLDLPVKPGTVLDRYSSLLAPHEREEVIKYNDIFYISDLGHKLPAKDEQEYDDDRGDYIVIRNDHIQYRYEILEMLGRGSFGQVIKVFDHKTKEQVALKIIRSPKKFHLQAKVEIKILKYMMNHHGADFNITELKDYFVFRKHVCLVFDLMSLNLYDFLKKNKFKGFSLNVIRKFAIQILYALKFMAHHKLIHCDLKPENILLKQLNKTGVKLIDFGSSCFENEKLYSYIQSRFYRSPEVILGLGYSTQIDMWSFGCLLCELYLGYPIFAGDSEADQLFAMTEVLGIPAQNLIVNSPKKSKFFDDNLTPKIVPNTKGKIRKPCSLTLESVMNCEDESFVSLVKNCLLYDSNSRFTPSDALAHEWILKGLPVDLKAQHMKLLEKTSPATSVREGALSIKDRRNTEELKIHEDLSSPKQEKIMIDVHQPAFHKKSFSGFIQKGDGFKTRDHTSNTIKTDTADEKTLPTEYTKKRINLSNNIVEDESIINITINLNDSKQSNGGPKKYSHTKQTSLSIPHTTTAKMSATNNFFYSVSAKGNNGLKRRDTATTPKTSQTGRTAVDEAETQTKARDTLTGSANSQKGKQRGFYQKSLSLEKKLVSPKNTDSLSKIFNPEENLALSAPRNIGFPTLKSPVAGKR